jgi:heme-binding NEAT domain protein
MTTDEESNEEEGSHKVSISMPAELYEQAVKRQVGFRYKKFSGYIQYLIERDVQSHSKVHVRTLSSEDDQAKLVKPSEPKKPKKPKPFNPDDRKRHNSDDH